jgi:hypothetical protein
MNKPTRFFSFFSSFLFFHSLLFKEEALIIESTSSASEMLSAEASQAAMKVYSLSLH